MKTWHWIALGLLALISLILEFTFLSEYDSHWWNKIPGFYILLGFIGCILIIYISKWIGYGLLYRDEQYYDR